MSIFLILKGSFLSLKLYKIATEINTDTDISHLLDPPREREVVGPIPGCDRPKSLKLLVVAFPLGAQNYGNSTATGQPVSG